jgi:hypothetical protein
MKVLIPVAVRVIDGVCTARCCTGGMKMVKEKGANG